MPTFFKRNKSEDQENPHQDFSVDEMSTPTKDFFVSLGVILGVLVIIGGLALGGHWLWRTYVSDQISDPVHVSQDGVPASNDNSQGVVEIPDQTHDVQPPIAASPQEPSKPVGETPDNLADTGVELAPVQWVIVGVISLIAALMATGRRLAYSLYLRLGQ